MPWDLASSRKCLIRYWNIPLKYVHIIYQSSKVVRLYQYISDPSSQAWWWIMITHSSWVLKQNAQPDSFDIENSLTKIHTNSDIDIDKKYNEHWFVNIKLWVSIRIWESHIISKIEWTFYLVLCKLLGLCISYRWAVVFYAILFKHCIVKWAW